MGWVAPGLYFIVPAALPLSNRNVTFYIRALHLLSPALAFKLGLGAFSLHIQSDSQTVYKVRVNNKTRV